MAYSSILSLELRLLRCTLSLPTPEDIPSPSPTTTTNSPHHQLAEEVVTLIEKGDYISALSSNAARLLLRFAQSCHSEDSIDSADQFYIQLQNNLHSSLQQQDSEDSSSWTVFLVLSVAVAAFLAFTQNNITGPCQSFPSSPVPFLQCIGGEWDIWARNQLMSSGSDLRGKFSLLQYIIYARMLLTTAKDFLVEKELGLFDGVRTVSWWLCRTLFLQQRILDDHVNSLFDLLQVLKAETVNRFGKVESVTSYWGTLLHEGEAVKIVSMAHLEAGIVEYNYGRIDQSVKHFDTAEEASDLELSVTGVLGFRTLHQVEAKAQLALVTDAVPPRTNGLWHKNSEIHTNASRLREDKLHLHTQEINDASDVLMTPKFLEKKMGSDGTENGGTSSAVPLMAIEQAIILSRCLILEKTARDDEIQRWDMAPFIEAVDAQEFTYYMIQRFCDILRIRWESVRSRTKERALLMMEKKVQDVNELSPGAVQRIPYSFGVYIPTIPELRKDYGELLVRCGLIGEALKIFEDLELWDNLIHCYSLLEKKASAVELIKARLCVTPNDPRLWCSLGDVTNIDSHYEKALEVSNNRSARAKRSLARSAYNRGDYKSSKILWESALALNSLYPDGWFAFGAAALKDRDMEKAVDGFTRAVQLDPDNGEAWNNLACLHMIKKNNKEAFIAFREALKFRRKSWKMWENFSKVALDIGKFDQALEAAMMVLDLTNNKRIDTDLLDRLMIEIESRVSKPNLSPSTSNDPNCSIKDHLPDSSESHIAEPVHKDHKLELSHETERLIEFLGSVLQQCIRSGMGGDIWGVYARWHKIKGDLTMCSEALLKQVRSYQGANLWSNRDQFVKFASASLHLCEVYMDISESSGSSRELNAAEMHLRNVVKQAAASFSDLEEFQDLQSCLEEVRKRLHASVASAGKK